MSTTLNQTNFSDYRRPFSEEQAVVSSSILFTLCALGISTNLVTIVVIARSSKLKSTLNCLIVSLCVSDLMSAVVSPFFMYRRTWGFDKWEAPNFICKAIWGIDLWTSFVTSAHILAFAAIRFVSLKSPSSYYELKRTYVKAAITAIWLTAFLFGFIPFFIMFGAKTRDRTSGAVDSKWPACTLNVDWVTTFRFYTAITYTLLFYLPMIALVGLSGSIVHHLLTKRKQRRALISKERHVEKCRPNVKAHRPVVQGPLDPRESCSLIVSEKSLGSKNNDSISCWKALGRRSGSGLDGRQVNLEGKRRKKENRIMLQLGLIVGSFFVGYLPLTVYHFHTTASRPSSYEAKVMDWMIGTAVYITLRISECLNPVFYNLASRKLRTETVRAFKVCCCAAATVRVQNNTKSTPTSSRPTAMGPSSCDSRDILDI